MGQYHWLKTPDTEVYTLLTGTWNIKHPARKTVRLLTAALLLLTVATKLIKHMQCCLSDFTFHMPYPDKTEMECRLEIMKCRIAEQNIQQDPPLSSTGDRQTSESMAFVSRLQRQQLLCCQIDEKALFAFLFVVALVFFSFSFFFYFVSKGHILSPLSREMISLKRSAEFPSTVQIAFHGYLFMLFSLSSVNLSSFSTTECW